MIRNAFWFAAAGIVLLVMVFWASGRPRIAGGDTIEISIASSSAKERWLHDSAATFMASSKRDSSLQVGGKAISVKILQENIDGKLVDYRSGTMVDDTLSGKIKPTVLSPGEESWIATMNREWQGTHAGPITSGPAPVLVTTPLAIAMWESRAKALDCWPVAGPGCTWARLRELAVSPDGWAMLGHPEWHDLRIGYGYPGQSNSGTVSVIVWCMLGVNKTAGLGVGDVDPANGCGRMISDFEAAKVHSGKKSDWLLGKMRTGGPEYLDAVITNEAEIIGFNLREGPNLREPLVAAYPQDGNVMFGHPFAILDGSPWVTPQQIEAAKIFRDFLLARPQQEAVVATGLRPVDPQVRIASPIEPRYGANPAAKVMPLPLPDALVSARVIEVWHQVKKHAIIAVVFDKSGSMEGEKLTAAIAGARAFVESMDPEDDLLWIPFDDKVYTGVHGLKSQIGERLVGDISSTTAGNGTALYDAVAEAYRQVKAESQGLGTSRRLGIVVLSDGKDTSSRQASLTLIETLLAPSEGDPTGIQIHTIGIGKDADKNVLSRIATSAHGKYWDATDPSKAAAIYRDIAVHY